MSNIISDNLAKRAAKLARSGSKPAVALAMLEAALSNPAIAPGFEFTALSRHFCAGTGANNKPSIENDTK